MLSAKVFQSGNSQAIRIPNEYRTTNKEFIIQRFGSCFFLIPPEDPWALLRQVLDQPLSDEDLAFDRSQPLLSDLTAREVI